ncbi:hypothetical protein ACVOMV_00140 [Mesorhizobium atlanticum]
MPTRPATLRDAAHMPAAPAPLAPQADIGVLIAEAVADAEAALESRLAVAHQAALEAERQVPATMPREPFLKASAATSALL